MNSSYAAHLLYIFFLIKLVSLAQIKKKEDCEVCYEVIEKFTNSIKGKNLNDALIQEEFKKFCSKTKGKDNKFCYYVGGLEQSATSVLKEISSPIKNSLPTTVICERIQKVVPDICDLKYDKQIDLDKVDLKKLKVKDLKKILNDWDEVCEGCIEKSDFIKRINELKPKFTKKTEL